MDLTAGLSVADRFRLVRPLGQGGMGSVWEAVQTSLGTPCALKFIHEEASTSAELRGRFEREAKAAAQIRSPHVVQIFDHGVWQGRAFIAMELLEGEDLAKRLRRRRPLAAVEVVTVVAQVARALTKAHAAGLIHRDLKPANIFLVRDDEQEIAKVLDFGVAKSTQAEASMSSEAETRTGAILGTPFYMSPEQARGNKDVDHRADLWALAVVVFQCLTGKLPFRSDALGDLLVKIIIEPLPVPSSIASVPPGFDAWWQHAADRDITRRFQTAKELADSLGLALDVTVAWSTMGSRASLPTGELWPTPPVFTPPLLTAPTPSPATPSGGGSVAAPSQPAPAHAAHAAPPEPIEPYDPDDEAPTRAAPDAVEPALTDALPAGGTPLSGVSHPDVELDAELARPRRDLRPVFATAITAVVALGAAAAFVGLGSPKTEGTSAPATTTPVALPPTPSAPSTPTADPSAAEPVAVATAAATATATSAPSAKAPAARTPAPPTTPATPATPRPGHGPKPPTGKPRTDFGI